jgi:hypothetical protein
VLDRGWGRAHLSIDASINKNEVPSGAPRLLSNALDLLALINDPRVEDKPENRRETGAMPDAESEAETTLALDVTAH